ncbi:hypothetical protein ACFC1R_22805 [Kitasatospora sp. NPDC056138]|uniref:hypothetical protein n=1 Tax=Kitasatospora sp. NPDC056138 TaxID=3345724 RepID=UPI0035D6AF7C
MRKNIWTKKTGKPLRRCLSCATAVLAVAGALAAAPAGRASAATELPFGPYTCKQGFVWRTAVADDQVCVTPADRTATAAENAAGPSHREPGGGPFGPDTCKLGFVWRETRPSDHVCVLPSRRDQARSDNSSAVVRLVFPGGTPQGGVTVTQLGGPASGRLLARGFGLSPGGEVQFWASTSGIEAAQLGSLTATDAGTLRWQSFYSATCSQPRSATVVVLDVASGEVTTAGTTSITPWC